jgi:glutamyl/glutaminyl-tRNA synthetase
MSREELIQRFDLSGISKSNAIFDEKKLLWMNSQYLAQTATNKLAPLVAEVFLERKIFSREWLANHQAYFAQAVELLKGRMKGIADFAEFGAYFFREPEDFEPSAREKYWKAPETAEWLEALAERFGSLSSYYLESIEATIRRYAKEKGLEAAKLIHATRLALTGFGVSPSLFEVMALLGKEKVVARLKRAAIIAQSDSIVVENHA